MLSFSARCNRKRTAMETRMGKVDARIGARRANHDTVRVTFFTSSRARSICICNHTLLLGRLHIDRRAALAIREAFDMIASPERSSPTKQSLAKANSTPSVLVINTSSSR